MSGRDARKMMEPLEEGSSFFLFKHEKTNGPGQVVRSIMAWLAFEEPIRRRACMLIFEEREKKACMQRSQCKSRYRGKDGWAHKKKGK
jgi:hypothetical protein